MLRRARSFRLMIWLGVVVLLIWSLGPIYWTLASAFHAAGRSHPRGRSHFLPPAVHPGAYANGCSASTVDLSAACIGLAAVPRGAGQQPRHLLRRDSLCVAHLRRSAAMPSRGCSFPGRDVIFVAWWSRRSPSPAYTVMIPLYRLMIVAASGRHLSRRHADLRLGLPAAGPVADAQRLRCRCRCRWKRRRSSMARAGSTPLPHRHAAGRRLG